MRANFCKYQGAGNDFIMLQDTSLEPKYQSILTREKIAQLCDRHFGIGADGLIILEKNLDTSTSEAFPYRMVYYNSNGAESTMCGNGGRCLARFAYDLELLPTDKGFAFMAIDGPHRAFASADTADISLQMKHVAASDISLKAGSWRLDTGSPHVVIPMEGLDEFNFTKLAKAIRYNAEFEEQGVNVNGVELIGGPTLEEGLALKIRTYERGVEDETLACGTGVTAAALALHRIKEWPSGDYSVPVHARGGDLSVRFHASANSYSDIWLIGPAVMIFDGWVEI